MLCSQESRGFSHGRFKDLVFKVTQRQKDMIIAPIIRDIKEECKYVGQNIQLADSYLNSKKQVTHVTDKFETVNVNLSRFITDVAYHYSKYVVYEMFINQKFLTSDSCVKDDDDSFEEGQLIDLTFLGVEDYITP